MFRDLKIDINQIDGYGYAELHYKVKMNDVSEVKRLLSQEADVNVKSIKHKRTPLHYAAKYNKGESYFEIAEMLLNNGADLNVKDCLDNTPLWYLVENGNMKIVQLFLKFKPDFKDLDDFGYNLLFSAIKNCDNLEVVQLFVDLGLDVNQCTRRGNSLLHEVAIENKEQSHLKVAELLINNGANINKQNIEGKTPLYHLVKHGNLNIVQFFFRFNADFKVVNEDGNSLLIPAAECNKHVEVVQLLIDLGLDVNQRGKYGYTPLHSACSSEFVNSAKIVECLLKNGACIHSRDDSHRTPLFNLVGTGNLQVVKMFLSYKPEVDIQDDGESTLLFQATYHKNVEIMQLLFDLGLDANHHDKEGRTSFWVANALVDYCTAGEYFKMMRCLLKNGGIANVNNIYSVIRKFGRRRVTKTIKKNLKLLIESIDFDVCRVFNILCIDFKHYSESVWKFILEHIAKLQFLNLPVSSEFLDVISRDKKYKVYYKECKEELLKLKSIKLLNSWITFYDLLEGSRKQLKNYAGNKSLIEDFKSGNWSKKFPIYGPAIEENVKKGIKRRELFDESTIVLSNCLPIFNPVHLIIKDVLDCTLSKKDLLILCD